MSSTGGSSDGGDSVHLRMHDENSERVAQAYQTLIEGGEIFDTITQLHGIFVQMNNKKLYVMRTTTSAKDAQTFAQHIIKQIEDKQSDPAGQEDTDLVERQDAILTNLKLITPDLMTDLYIMLNKAKKSSDPKDQAEKSNKGKRKAKGKKTKATRDETSAEVTGDGGHHESDDGTENRNLESTRTTAGGPSRQLSLNSQASSPAKRSLRSRQISGSSGAGADAVASSQHSQASATTIQRRRSKQKTRFVISDDEEDEEA